MLRFCCYINGKTLEVTRCDFDLGMKRRISPQAKMVFLVDSDVAGAVEIKYRADLRLLLRQRGSRL